MVNKKPNMMKRYQASYDTKEGSSSSRKGIMNYRKLEGEITFFSPQEGRSKINIIPYTIKTKNHPLVRKGEFEVGDKDYVMDVYTHRSVGPTEATVLCLKGTYGKPCPICELSAKLRKDGKEEEAKELKSSRRVFYNIEDLKEPGKLKIFETSHFLFEKELIDEARDDEEGGFVDFADPVDGKEIKFKASKVSAGGREFLEFKSFSFESRDEEISDELLDSAVSFDEIMSVPTYEEVEKILYGADEEDDAGTNHEEDEGTYDGEEYEVPTTPKAKVKGKEVDLAKQALEEEDDEPEPPKKSCSGKCPFGHKFGIDTDSSDDCDKCDCWDKCCKGE